MVRVGPGPVTPITTEPIDAAVGAVDDWGAGVAGVVKELDVPEKVTTEAALGVIDTRLFNVRGQSMAVLTTLARRRRPAV